MERALQTSSATRRWRIPLAVWLGAVLLLGSVLIASLSMHSHASDAARGATAAPLGTEHRWMAIGYADVEGGVTPLYPLQPGKVKTIEARENEPVEANAPLFHMDDALAVFQVQQAENALAVAKDRLVGAQQEAARHRESVAAQKEAIAAARLDVELARLQRDRLKSIYQKLDTSGVQANSADLQSAELQFQKAETAVKGQERKLAVLEAMKPEVAVNLAQKDIEDKEILVRKARKAADECIVRAPVRGTPLRVLIHVGETLGPNPRQPAVQFCPDRPLIVRAEVEQEFADRLRKDQPTVVQDHITGQECGHGKVASISRWYTHRRSILLDPLQFNDVRTLECIIKLDPATRELRIGQRVRVKFTDSDK